MLCFIPLWRHTHVGLTFARCHYPTAMSFAIATHWMRTAHLHVQPAHQCLARYQTVPLLLHSMAPLRWQEHFEVYRARFSSRVLKLLFSSCVLKLHVTSLQLCAEVACHVLSAVCSTCIRYPLLPPDSMLDSSWSEQRRWNHHANVSSTNIESEGRRGGKSQFANHADAGAGGKPSNRFLDTTLALHRRSR